MIIPHSLSFCNCIFFIFGVKINLTPGFKFWIEIHASNNFALKISKVVEKESSKISCGSSRNPCLIVAVYGSTQHIHAVSENTNIFNYIFVQLRICIS